jgi:hypothetical protein
MAGEEEQLFVETIDEDEAPSRPYSGRELLAWIVDEYERHQRGPLWYALSAVFGLAMLLYSILTQNFLFAVIVIMFGVITGLSVMREPRKMLVVVTDLGIGIGNDFYPYKTFRNFWILYEPPEVKNIYLEFKVMPARRLSIPLYEQNPVEVRNALVRFLDEDLEKEDQPMSEFIGRTLKL